MNRLLQHTNGGWRAKNAGFTLVELLVTLVLLALLVTSASPVVQLNAKREKERELKRALWQIRDAIDD